MLGHGPFSDVAFMALHPQQLMTLCTTAATKKFTQTLLKRNSLQNYKLHSAWMSCDLFRILNHWDIATELEWWQLLGDVFWNHLIHLHHLQRGYWLWLYPFQRKNQRGSPCHFDFSSSMKRTGNILCGLVIAKETYYQCVSNGTMWFLQLNVH